jgi:hypothetical protein
MPEALKKLMEIRLFGLSQFPANGWPTKKGLQASCNPLKI